MTRTESPRAPVREMPNAERRQANRVQTFFARRLLVALGLLVATTSGSGCVVRGGYAESPGRGCPGGVWVGGHYGPRGFWHPGHWRCPGVVEVIEVR